MLILSRTAAGRQQNNTFPGANVWQLPRNPLERTTSKHSLSLLMTLGLKPLQASRLFCSHCVLQFGNLDAEQNYLQSGVTSSASMVYIFNNMCQELQKLRRNKGHQ